jgi:hypothetical protein
MYIAYGLIEELPTGLPVFINFVRGWFESEF